MGAKLAVLEKIFAAFISNEHSTDDDTNQMLEIEAEISEFIVKIDENVPEIKIATNLFK